MTRPRDIDRADFDEASQHLSRSCAAPNCAEAGMYRAPMSRDQPRNYYWFCLEHVRAYNHAWDFYKGMNENQIEAERRKDAVWRRPSWRLGGRRGFMADGAGPQFQDTFGLFEGASEQRNHRRATSPEAEALAVLGLGTAADPPTVKLRYISLVKKLHPDRNGDNPKSEERLKRVNQAYATLKKSFTP